MTHQEEGMTDTSWFTKFCGRQLLTANISMTCRISRANLGASVDFNAVAKRRRSTVTSIRSKEDSTEEQKQKPKSKRPLDVGLCLTAPEYDNPMARTNIKISVNARVLQRVVKGVLRYSGRVKPVFDFYCRLTDPSNRGFMSFLNFRRLLRDCEAMDDIVTANIVNLQLLTITRNKAKQRLEHDERTKQKQAGRASSIAAETFGGKLDLEMFVEALCRVSELIRIGRLR